MPGRAALMASWLLSPSSRLVGVKVTRAVCTVWLSAPARVTVGVMVVSSEVVTPLPVADTAKSGVAEPGRSAPVVVVKVRGKLIISPDNRGRLRVMVAVAVALAFPSLIRVSLEVSSTTVGSSSSMNHDWLSSVNETV